MDLLFSPHARWSHSEPQAVSNAAANRSIFTQALRTLDRSGGVGDHFKIAISVDNASNSNPYLSNYAEQSVLRALTAKARGNVARWWIGDPSYVKRGAMPTGESLANNIFTSGTSGWTGSNATLTVSDRIMRATFTGGAGVAQVTQAVSSMVANAPYVLRVFASDGRGRPLAAGAFHSYVEGSAVISHAATTAGMSTLAIVTDSSSGTQYLVYPTTGAYPVGVVAGDYVEFSYTSLSRCALVDIGANLLTYSDDITQASAWTSTGISPTFGASSPDGTSTTSRIIENAGTSGHFTTHAAATVPSTALDYAFSCIVVAGTRSWCFIQMTEGTGSTSAFAYFNTSTGLFGTTGTGANWANLRTFTKNIGGSFYEITLIARKTNASTSLTAVVGSASADNTNSYAGSAGANSTNVWRATLSQSAVPMRRVQTTTSATTGTVPTGAAMQTKGWPANSSGLLLPDDRVQIGTQRNIVTASLDSDAAGLGYLQCALPWRNQIADNDPIVIHNPMGRYIQTQPSTGWSDMPGRLSSFQFEFEEAMDA